MVLKHLGREHLSRKRPVFELISSHVWALSWAQMRLFASLILMRNIGRNCPHIAAVGREHIALTSDSIRDRDDRPAAEQFEPLRERN